MPIIRVKNIKSAVTGSQIFQRFDKRGRIVYHYYPQNDCLQQRLLELADLYKTHPTKKIKKRILGVERKILYQELENPQLTIVRNAKELLKGISKILNYDKFIAWIHGLNVEGIYRIECMQDCFASVFTPRKAAKLKKAFTRLSENNEQALKTKQQIIELLSYHSNNDALIELSKSTKSKSLKYLIKQKTGKYQYNYAKAISELQDNPFQLNKLKLFLMNLNSKTIETRGTKTQREFATRIIRDILTAENVKPAIKRLAVWGAGKYKSAKAFDVIKSIAINKHEKDVRLREVAIHSVAMYIKNKPEEVKEILSKITNDKTIFSPLGKILLDKVTGNYHGQVNREYKYLGIDEQSAEEYKNIIKNLIYKSGTKTNPHIENEIDRGMLFFKSILKLFNANKVNCYITNDSLTKIDLNATATRTLRPYLGANIGEFNDTVKGGFEFIKKYIVLGNDDFQQANNYNALAHEYAHCWHYLLKGNDYAKVKELYKEALKKHKIIDSYAALDEFEYFAQGCEAMCSVYKPHSEFINDYNVLAHTKYELLAKDSKLYHFIENLFARYSK